MLRLRVPSTCTEPSMLVRRMPWRGGNGWAATLCHYIAMCCPRRVSFSVPFLHVAISRSSARVPRVGVRRPRVVQRASLHVDSSRQPKLWAQQLAPERCGGLAMLSNILRPGAGCCCHTRCMLHDICGRPTPRRDACVRTCGAASPTPPCTARYRDRSHSASRPRRRLGRGLMALSPPFVWSPFEQAGGVGAEPRGSAPTGAIEVSTNY